ncbi:MAG TPA: alpha-amylase family glycosyl hydrolase [Pantanalinema sp.]
MRKRFGKALLAGAVLLSGCGLSPFQSAGAKDQGMRAQALSGTPGWAKNAVFYQIFPERFANGDRANDPRGVEPWGATPTFDNFMGGDLDGVTQKLPYLKELGVNALYFNPVFSSSSNHKYNTRDYMHVDPAFGGDAAFLRMLKAAHGLGMKVMLDGVFNHTGDDSPLFQDCKEKGEKSPYWNWYSIWGFPVTTTPKPNYNAWWGFGTLPQLRAASNPEVQKYLFSVEEHWLRQGIDGWRLDVPNEIDSDDFWRTFRKKARAINPEAYIVGEIWEDADRWLQGDQFDSVMNYVWRKHMLGFFAHGTMNVDQFDGGLEALRNKYAPETTQAMFNILGSHDVPRFLSEAGGDVSKLKLAVLFQMTYPGAPVVYYGDEIGMQGAKDPDNRRAFEWTQSRQNRDLLGFYRQLIALRNANPVLRTGAFRSIRRHNDLGLFGYVRELGQQKVAVLMNNSASAREWSLDVSSAFSDGTKLSDPLTGQAYAVQEGHVPLKLAPKQGIILMPVASRR